MKTEFQLPCEAKVLIRWTSGGYIAPVTIESPGFFFLKNLDDVIRCGHQLGFVFDIRGLGKLIRELIKLYLKRRYFRWRGLHFFD